jgi:hypothetical protein
MDFDSGIRTLGPIEIDKKRRSKTTGTGKVGKFKGGGKSEKEPKRAFPGAATPFQKKSK